MFASFYIPLQRNLIEIDMRILSAQQFNCKLKVTIQQTGRMNFTADTANALGLTVGKGVKFFTDGEPEQLCMAIMREKDADSFSIIRSGAYYYVPAQLMFDDLGVDYRNYTVFYDLVRCAGYDQEVGGQCYKMNKRQIKKKKGGETDDVAQE